MANSLRMAVLLVVAGGLGACSLTAPYERPEMTLPAGWRGGDAAADAEMAADWWTLFGSTDLTQLVEYALIENNELRAGLHRVAQARAQVRIAGANLYPGVTAGGSLARDWREPFSGDRSGITSYRGQLDVGYEVDLWQRNAATADAARLRAEAAAWDRTALALVVASDVVLLYADILASNEQLAITRERLDNVREILAIVEARFREGAVSGLELAQQRTELANLEAAVAGLERQRQVTANQLAVLVARPPQDFAAPDGDLGALALPAVALHPPAELLARRPDLQSAEAALVAAHADIATARAAFFPSLFLGGGLTVAGNPIGSAATTAAGIAASLSAPIFQGGRIAGRVDQAEAARDELVERYRQAVLRSFQEAEDALALLEAADRRLLAYGEAVIQAEQAHAISMERFDAGTIDFLTLLEAQRSLLQAQENLVFARLDRLSATVLLYKAMGGSLG